MIYFDNTKKNLNYLSKWNNQEFDKIKHNCKGDDWLIGFPEISFYNDTIAVSSKAFRAKDYKNDLRINNYIQCTLYYLYNAETESWDICKTATGTGRISKIR